MTYLEPPFAGNEVNTLLGSLERQRATLLWKCEGLDAEGLHKAKVGASAITLGGLLKHLAGCEDYKFGVMLHGRTIMAPFDTADFDADPDWDWHSAAEDTPEQIYSLWHQAVERSRAQIAEAITKGGLDFAAVRGWPDGRSPSLRRLLIDMIEEYARHTGHADLIRESIDGRVGEDPPGGRVAYPGPVPPDATGQ
jgi:hypothetical protein